MSDKRVQKVGPDDVAINRKRGAEMRVLLSPKTVGSTTGLMGICRLQPGEFITEHYHPYSEEAVYAVSGTSVMRIDGSYDVELNPGEALLIPREVRHRLENRGDEEAVVTFQLAPLAPRPELGHVDTEQLPGAVAEDATAAR